MRILRISQNLYPEQPGGASYHVHAMSRDQAEMGHEVTVLTTRNSDDIPRVETRDGYEVRRFDTLVSPIGNDISVGLARYLRQASEFDVIHAHSHLYFSTNLAALKRRFGDVPLAITNHGLYSQSAPEQMFRWYLKTLGRWTFNQADVIFCYTESEAEQLRTLGVTTETAIVQNGIDTDRFTPEGPNSELLEEGDIKLLFVGRLVPGKRPELAIDTLYKFRQSEPDAVLYICGEGPLRDVLQQRIGELEIGDYVHLLGHVPFDEMPKIYRSSDVLLLPSQAEGMPRTVLEAMATNVSVVISQIDHLTDIGSKQTIQVDFTDSVEVANAIRVVVNTEGEDLRESITDSFRWKHTVEETTELIERCNP